MEGNNNNNGGRGIFYGVIGVATLIVSIIGATFAYFSAVANSDPNAVRTESAQIGLNYSDTQTYLKTNLIPVDATDALFAPFPADSTVQSSGGHDCIDTVGNNICSVYQFTVTNPNNAAATIYLYLKSTNNEFTNLRFALFKVTLAELSASTNSNKFSLSQSTITPTTSGVGMIKGNTAVAATGSQVALTEATLQLAPTGQTGDSITYTLLLWVQETSSDQNEADANKVFEGQIYVDTGTGSGITGKLSA